MIDATKAVEIAQDKLPHVVPAFASLKPVVEEVDQSSDGKLWLITFRAKNPDPEGESPYGGAIFVPFVDKLVKIASASGELQGVVNPAYR